MYQTWNYRTVIGNSNINPVFKSGDLVLESRKEFTDKLDFIKIKTSSVKDVKKIRGQATDWDKLFAKQWGKKKKKMLSQIYCWLLKLNSKKTTWLKNVPKTLRDSSPKITYGRQTSIWKDALHHMSSGKRKLKQDTTMYLLEWPV